MKKLTFYLVVILSAYLSYACSGPKSNDEKNSIRHEEVKTNNLDEATTNALLDYGYKILKEEKFQNIKKTIYIQIPNQLSENDLTKIASQIKRENSTFERLFIFYLLPEMKIGSGAWATTHYNPTLEVNIMGVDKTTEEKLKNIEGVSGQIIGKWYDKTPYVEHSILIYKSNGQIKMKEVYKDGSKNEKVLKASKYSGKQKFDYKNDFGEYMLIEKDGNIGVYDRDGLISIAKKIE